MADILKFMHCGCTYTFGNAKGLPEEAFGDGSDGDCTVCYDAETVGNVFWEAKEYNFDNLTICEGVKLRFCGQGVPIIRVKNCFINEGEINLRAPLLNIGQTVEEKYTGKEISSYKNDCYDIALSHYNTMVSCCEKLKNCLTLENLSGVCASGGANGLTCSGGYGGKGGRGGGGTSLNGTAGETGNTNYNLYDNGGAAGTSSYENAGGGGGGGGFGAAYGSKTILQNAQAGGNAGDGIGGKGGDGTNVVLTDNSRYPSCTLIVAGAGGGGGGGWGYCRGGDGGNGGLIVACCCSSSCCKSGNGGNGGNSYLGKAGNGGKSWGNNMNNYYPGKGGNGGCSYCGDGGDAGHTICGSDVCGGCSIYGNGGNVSGWCLFNGNGGSSVYGDGGCSNISCYGNGCGGNSYYGNGGNTNGYGSIPGGSVYGNGGTSYSNDTSSTRNGGSSIYGKGGDTCNAGSYYGGNGIEGGINNYGNGATGNAAHYGIARGGVYGLGLFANSLNNEGCIYGRGGCGRICSRGAEIVIGYKTLLCNTGGISYEGCAAACNGKLTVIQG